MLLSSYQSHLQIAKKRTSMIELISINPLSQPNCELCIRNHELKSLDYQHKIAKNLYFSRLILILGVLNDLSVNPWTEKIKKLK